MSGIFHEAGFWVAVSFVLFFVLVGKKIWTPLAAILDSRADRIRKELDEAADLRREAEQMLEDATREREHALAEARSLIEQSRKQAQDIALKARQEAEDAVKRHEQMARDRIAAVERAALKEVRQLAIDVAVEAAHDVIPQTLDTKSGSALVDQALAGLPKALAAHAA
ncbi:ATP synthase subunit b [Acetobacter peroxydans]|jgi:F-type H+-transporting ATPase subunit b|uniref:ATP synthase subunit b n=1 Tax=Acetobacter peroxydans TaxID=104098 RepID=A0A4Y3TUV5_9PROT|nr:F0F1 ATP synthase subunit B [Acetobacter peroxydans]NHO16615.1 F0F1 ATP synthase subunit B [Acetobacter peroxydans]GBR37204.1 ATP synthase F0 subunit beta' [Acetobacter peroxydans NBRC 13755]GBR38996.1 ATP synthase F0 subunit beta' [Acetobacter peroxydans]GEB85488.1 ATP synthase subunit b [Acetobacter peroxydans]